ncbi:MAG: sigma-70 family RNA polymerase sigma factor [Acidobacteria bacterium]|nr:sigma-70 family RNA polymerase sigma factor [Acidobacteriota bacterium]
MSPSSPHEVTQLLLAWNNGDQDALTKLAPLVETELRRLAKVYLAQERPGHTLQPTELVNEAFIKLIDVTVVEWKNRSHFFGITAQLMRHILVDHARRRQAMKHGGEAVRVSLVEAENVAPIRQACIIELDDALSELARFDERKSRIVELKFFGGLSEEEISELLDISLRTVQRDWNLARSWLYRQLNKDRQPT